MRQIEHDMVAAIRCRDSFNKDNTEVIQSEHGYAEVRLFGNIIACLNYDTGIMTIKDSGHRTNATKSRLNALLDMLTKTGGDQGIYQRAGKWYWEGSMPWTGTATVRLVL
jgi:hypothetical protein